MSSKRSVDPRAHSRRTEAELIEALAEDEAKQGRPHTPGEREAFARAFFGEEYRREVHALTLDALMSAIFPDAGDE